MVATSEPLKGDQPRARVRWRSGAAPGEDGEGGLLARHSDAIVQLRFRMSDASLYSYWFEAS